MADRTTSAPDDPFPEPAPGTRLGLPASGPGSVSGWGRRFLGLVVDWVVASLVARASLSGVGRDLGPLLVFLLMHLLLVSTIGMTIGHAVTGTAVRRLDGRPVGFALGLARAVLVTLVIPAVVYDGDRRGLHDRASRTVVVRR
ncbi:RDD family protein [Kineococcus aurantiacus]|uniref:Putative RDD family membrane protein YckC n=1 Tax=Kineococcus aurantiacus TaxID=37633 RepID=A0A7Y9ASB6_9ACTN|nr:putative RDD family membrane protein YckC [Kineococcus aurantiacus]